jgi:glutamyl-tRNA synthetase
MRNYLLRLGWSHGDDEIMSLDDAVNWFSFANVGRGPSRFDLAKLDSVNAHYIKEADDARLVGLLGPFLGKTLAPGDRLRLLRAMPGLKPRAKTLVELARKAAFYIAERPLTPEPEAAKLLTQEARALLGELRGNLGETWEHDALEAGLRDFASQKGLKLGAVAQPLRAALTGSTASPGIFEVMEVLGRDETLARLGDAADESA